MMVDAFKRFDKGAHLSSVHRREELLPLLSRRGKGPLESLTRRDGHPFKAARDLLELTDTRPILLHRAKRVPKDDPAILEVVQQHLDRVPRNRSFPNWPWSPSGALTSVDWSCNR